MEASNNWEHGTPAERPQHIPFNVISIPSGKKNSQITRESANDHGEPQWIGGYGNPVDRSKWLKVKALHMRFNPVVTFSSIVLIWGFIIWCMIDDNVPFHEWQTFITEKFTWLYVGSQDVWAVFIVVVYFSKYGSLKLGKPMDGPDFSIGTWFTMLFAAGIGVGLFFFGVAEPLWHYDPSGGGNRYMSDPTIPDNTLAQIAINLTLYHWGIHGWIVYCVLGLMLALISYREGLPMTLKSCFYPLIGDLIYSWLGDAIDILSIITTMFGVCTSLGLGAAQINAGMTIVISDIEINDTNQVIIIWCITFIATMSTLSGLTVGIRRLSEICFGCGVIVMSVVWMNDDPWFLLNCFTQSVGYYFQWILQLGFHCDAFEMRGPSYGGEDRNRYVPEGFDTTDGPSKWMDWWTIGYWGWWISWSPFVGMFIAKISKGRTVREFINGTMTAPIIYTFLWFTWMGGAAIAMEREAAGINLCCGQNIVAANISAYIEQNATLTTSSELSLDDTWICGTEECNRCSLNVLKRFKGTTFEKFISIVANDDQFNVATEDDDFVRLSCLGKESMWFSFIGHYGDLAPFMKVFSMFCVALYFITSSDSGSLVIDCLSANGDPEPPRIQRVFWALTEGACATALLIAAGDTGLTSLQAMNIATGLPYTIVICFVCVAVWRCMRVTSFDVDPNGPQFKVGYFDVFASLDHVLWRNLFLNFVIAPWIIGKCAEKLYSKSKPWIYMLISGILLILFIVLYIMEIWISGMFSFAWIAYCIFCLIIANIRADIRERYNMEEGSFVEDFMIAFFYPLATLQFQVQLEEDFPPKKTQREREEERQRRTLVYQMKIKEARGYDFFSKNELSTEQHPGRDNAGFDGLGYEKQPHKNLVTKELATEVHQPRPIYSFTSGNVRHPNENLTAQQKYYPTQAAALQLHAQGTAM